jgi:Domain of unknown function (DUF4397)
MFPRSMRVAVALSAFAVVATVGIMPVSAAPLAAAHVPASNEVMVRGGHFSPNTPGVDVYLTSFSGKKSTLWLSNVGYGDVSGYESIAAGIYAVSMRLHGASPSSPAALSWTLNATGGHAYTAAAVGMNSQLKGIVLDDQLNPPPAGKGLVRVIQAASRAPEVNVVAQDGPVVAHNAAFATTTGYASVSAGTWPLQASSVESPALTTSASVSIGSATVSSLIVLDGKQGGLTLKSIVDAGGTAVTPAGSVNAGGGGTAAHPNWFDRFGWTGTGALLAGLILIAGSVIGLGRNRSARHSG